MKKRVKRDARKRRAGKRTGIAVLIFALAASFSIGIASPAYASEIGEWRHNSRGWWYRLNTGKYPAGTWKQIDGEWYYFNGNKYMATGWKEIEGKWYYLGDDGAMRSDAWIGDYYVGSDGAMLTDTTTPDGIMVGSDGKRTGNSQANNEVYGLG